MDLPFVKWWNCCGEGVRGSSMDGCPWMAVDGATQMVIGYFFVLQTQTKRIAITYHLNSHSPLLHLFVVYIITCCSFHRILAEDQLMGVYGNCRWWPRLGDRPTAKMWPCTYSGRSEAMAVAAKQRITSMDDVYVVTDTWTKLRGWKAIIGGGRGCGDEAVGFWPWWLFCFGRSEKWTLMWTKIEGVNFHFEYS